MEMLCLAVGCPESGSGSDYICTPQITWRVVVTLGPGLSRKLGLRTLLFGVAGYRKDFSHHSHSCVDGD